MLAQQLGLENVKELHGIGEAQGAPALLARAKPLEGSARCEANVFLGGSNDAQEKNGLLDLEDEHPEVQEWWLR